MDSSGRLRVPGGRPAAQTAGGAVRAQPQYDSSVVIADSDAGSDAVERLV